MTLAQLIIGVVAAGATLLAAWYARDASTEARKTVQLSKEMAQFGERAALAAEKSLNHSAAVSRRMALTERRRRIEDIARSVERIYFAGDDSIIWMEERRVLSFLVVGLKEDLPCTVEMLRAQTYVEAMQRIGPARGELETDLANTSIHDTIAGVVQDRSTVEST